MKIFWCDLETTGIDELENGIIQLACIVEIDGQLYDGHNYRMNPFKWRPGVDMNALRVNGITMADIMNYPRADAVKREIEMLLSHYVNRYDNRDKFYAAGFNVDFDVKFLRELWSICDDPYFNSWFHFANIDPVRIIPIMNYMNVLDYNGKYRLEDIAKYFDVYEEGAHDALIDIRMTRNIMLKICERFWQDARKGLEYATDITHE